MNIPNQLQASRVEELLIGIMVKAAQTGGCLPESRRQGILALFQRHMRCEAKQLAAVQSLIREAETGQAELFALAAEFRSRLEPPPPCTRLAYSSCLLLTKTVYRLIHSGGQPGPAEVTRARRLAGQLGILPADLSGIEAQWGLAAQSTPASNGACSGNRPAAGAGQDRFAWLYVNIMVQIGLLDGHFTRTKLRTILEFFLANMLCSKERIQQLRQMAKDAWERSGQPERSLNVLARAFHQDFNYATRHMLLERVFQLISLGGRPLARELQASRDLAGQLRIFSEDLKRLEEKYRQLADAQRQQAAQARQEARTREEKARNQARGPHRAGAGEQREARGRTRRKNAAPPQVPLEEAACCDLLRVRPGANLAVIRRAWHERVMEYHPDRLAYLGPEFVALAEQKTKAINAAYAYFTEKYNEFGEEPF